MSTDVPAAVNTVFRFGAAAAESKRVVAHGDCACGVEEGEDCQLEELAGACVICHVSHFTDKTTGETRHYISYLRESEVGDTAQTLNADEFATISNDDIPF